MANASTDGPTWVSQMQLPDSQIGSTQKFADCAHRTNKTTNNKRIIACCDGTWNNSNKMGGIPTNVARISAAIARKCCNGMPQIVYYTRGAGTDSSKVGQYLGGVLGKGVVQDIADTYRFICDNYNPGDEIIILGFSRGAFTARSVSGLVCNIGLLNRVGLSQFGAIFHDYQNFANWKPDGKFNKDDHLVGFTLSNLERLEIFKAGPARRSNAALEKALDENKQEIFKSMVECKGGNGQTRLREMAQLYRKGLVEHEMILCQRKSRNEGGRIVNEFVPTEVKVKAVGVWDTVGSLGWPKMPWEKIRKDRSADELRFASLDVHPKVEHAFHALALDEWRTAFKPTLWGMKDNSTTNLRQVWFPGSHSNVGGGFPDQQIASIAMAWMADQLTSIGVEFSTPEMKRLFYTLEPGVKPREWALGRIANPDATTSIPDQAYNALWYPWQRLNRENTVLGTRTPGNYKEDDKKTLIKDPNEFIHPSVRIRYLYKGLGLDDEDEWECAALTKNGYTLEKSTEPPKLGDQYLRDPIASTYETLSGKVSSVHGGHALETQSHKDHTLVVHQMPFERDLCLLDQAKNQWVWTKDVGDGKKTIQEERIGMWERLFIDINHKMVQRQKSDEKAAKTAPSSGQSKKFSLKRLFYDGYQFAKGRAGKMLNRAFDGLLGPSVKPMPRALDYPQKHGYHDMISWQLGDTTKTRPKNPW
ncbi:uncharacterized protein LY79DRAFT_517073 [Colletotrichum navitas]|uniref:T6SS Phospholipase effector Tle1-like catalytic domain-containing protein n=1 Tax=Colletotrichum navitas TaxID=681940 RepID=A0AAD8PXB3_9PEZI|nr:uncharacterized protein LY79DRAFT_517073 [Colletotrichum navitas]KAK1589811.1 hypothetical protein LY79DRAFT_517073 [Colletotrichum navitas]